MAQTNLAIARPPRITVIDPRTPETAKLRVAAYARVSSDSEDQVNSYLAQVDHYTRYISSKEDWEMVDIYADLRHTYAVNVIRAGDDIKTIQGNLGHSSAAFTLDRYGHFTEQMREDSAARMNEFMKAALNL